MEIYAKNLHIAILLRSAMPTSDISKFLYDFSCLNRALDNSTINSYQNFLHLKILLRNMIPTCGARQLHYENLCKKAAFSNFTKKCDAFKWYW